MKSFIRLKKLIQRLLDRRRWTRLSNGHKTSSRIHDSIIETSEDPQRQKETNSIFSMHSLPYEALVHIFELTVRKRCKCRNATCNSWRTSIPLSEGYVLIDRRHRPLRPPSYKGILVLSSVCSYWRRIIIDSATFWTRIELPIKNTNFLKMILHRSRSAPLDVSVRIASRDTEVGSVDVACINLFLAENMHRIGRLSLGTSGFRQITLPDASASAPFLRFICIDAGKYQEIATARLDFISPRLEDVLLFGARIPMSSYKILEHVQRLTLTTAWFQRSYGAWSVHEVVRVLSYCQGTIVELEFESTRTTSPQDFKEKSHLILPQLRRLVWTAFKPSPNLLDYIVTPAIQTLRIHSHYGLDVESSQVVPSSLVQLSGRLPGALDVYHIGYSLGVGINLYLDSSREEKLFAFNYNTFHRQERQENGYDACTCVSVLATFLQAQKLSSVKCARLSSDLKEVEMGMQSILRLLPNVVEVDFWEAMGNI